ncbi:MAG: outer membrane lipoprotein carrier protein LolA [Proteobacteria bacterium]|nr:outer membrane lipoprotein carrier protein LolA [Pseudomonadota bacterium]
MTKLLKSLTVAFALGLSALTVAPAIATNPTPIALNSAQTAAMQRINTYINSFQSLRGEFTQISPKGQTTRGILFLSKPGKIRFDYAPPNPLLIVSDGKWLTIKNRAKEKGDQVPLNSTPLRFIVAPKIDLMKEASVLSFEEADGLTTVALADREGKLGGYIVIVYDNVQDTLQQWVIVDGKGRRTTVQFANLERDVQIDQKLFRETIKRKDKN